MPQTGSPANLSADAAIEFLRTFDPDGRHNLVAFHPDDTPMGAITIEPKQWDRAEAFITAHNGVHNLYFSVNEPRAGAPDKKLAKADIAALRAVFADVDPAAGDREAARQHIRDTANDVLKLKPSLIVDSGSGFHFYWLLDAKLPPTETERAESQGRGIAALIGGDPVENIDRILRLPGTLNIPGKKKLAKGRVAAVSAVVEQGGARYGLDVLETAYRPLAAALHDDKSAEVGALMRTLDMGYVYHAVSLESADADLRVKFDAARQLSPRLSAIWDGVEDIGPDKSNSAWRWALATALKWAGDFTPDEFGALLNVWPQVDPEQLDERVISRDWIRSPGPSLSFFDDLEANPPPEQNPFAVMASSPENEAPAPAPIKWLRPSEWGGVAPPEREWEVKGWIPRRQVTLLYGDGGLGKSLLAQQYATCAAAGLPFLGQPTRRARVMCFFCEEEEDELHRRQIDINKALGLTMADSADGLAITSRSHHDNLMALFDFRTGAITRQAIWHQLLADARAFRADVIILDTLADIYSGAEMDRGQVTAFVKSVLGKLAFEIGGSVIVLGHPSVSGKQTGNGTSGSTAWSNAVRSRLYLQYPKGRENTDARELIGKKMNYGAAGNVIKLRWERGAFAAVAASTRGSADLETGDGALMAVPGVEVAAGDALLAAIRLCHGQRMSEARNSPFFEIKMLRRGAGVLLDDFGDQELEIALHKLKQAGAVVSREAGRDAARRSFNGLVAIADRLSASDADEGIFA